MASVLYFGKDDRIPKMLDQIFQDRLKEAGEASSILKVDDERKLDEALVAMAFDVIFVEQAVVTNPANPNSSSSEWLANARKTKPALRCPMVLVGTEADQVKVFKHIESGWIDYMLLPPDKLLLIEKIWMFASGKRSSDMRQVYSMNMSQQADVAKPAVVEELSEFDCKVRTSQALQMNELMVIYSKAFGAEAAVANASILARCYQSEPHPSFEGQFKNSCYFVGVTPEALTNIRNTLRKQFVSGKAKS